MPKARAAMDGVAQGALLNLLARLGTVAAVLALTAWTARLGPQVQGAFALFTSVEGVLLALASGCGVALARLAPTAQRQPDGGLAERRAAALACVLLGALATPLLWALALRGPPAYSALSLLAMAAPFVLLAPNLAGWWLGTSRMRPMALASVLPPVLALAAVLLAALLGYSGLAWVLGAWVGARVLVGLAVALRLLAAEPAAGPGKPATPAGPWRIATAQAGFVLTIGLTNLVGLLNYRVGLFVVERLLGLAATGVYSIAVVVAELLWFVSSALTQAVYGRLGAADGATAAALTLRVVQLSLLVLVTAATPLALAAWLLLPWLLGPAYAASVPLLVLLLPGVLLFGGASALSAWFTQHRGQPQVPALVAGASLVLNLLLALWLVPGLGAAGAAIAASVAYACTAVLLAALFLRAAGLPWRALLRPGSHLAADVQGVASLLLMPFQYLARRP